MKTFNTKYDPYRPIPSADITIILDRSGSMSSVKQATIDGFNEFIGSQLSEEGKAKVSLVQFDNKYEKVYKSLPIDSVPKLCKDTFVPRGMTALNDAIGKTIKQTEKRLNGCGDKVIFVILTDGMENASVKYSTEKIAELVKHQKECKGWEFIFIGANQDVVLTAKKYNFNPDLAIRYTQGTVGTNSVFHSTSSVVSNLRKGVTASYSEDMRKEALKQDA